MAKRIRRLKKKKREGDSTPKLTPTPQGPAWIGGAILAAAVASTGWAAHGEPPNAGGDAAISAPDRSPASDAGTSPLQIAVQPDARVVPPTARPIDPVELRQSDPPMPPTPPPMIAPPPMIEPPMIEPAPTPAQPKGPTPDAGSSADGGVSPADKRARKAKPKDKQTPKELREPRDLPPMIAPPR